MCTKQIRKMRISDVLVISLLALISIASCQDVIPSQDTTSSPMDSTLSRDTSTSESTISVSSSTVITTSLDELPKSTDQIASSTQDSISSIPFVNSSTPDPVPVNVQVVNSLSNRVLDALKNLQTMHSDLSFPGQPILQDPLSIPSRNISFGFVDGEFNDIQVYGLSNFTVEGVNTVLDQMEVYTIIKIEKINIVGNCSVDTLIGYKSQGPFNITLTNVTAEGTVFLSVKPDGTLVANRTISDMTYEDLVVSTSSDAMLQSALKGGGIAVLLVLKPLILHQIEEYVTREVNNQLVNMPKVPAIVDRSPIDLAIIEARKYVAQNHEPYTIRKILEHNSEFLEVFVGPVTVKGLSKFSRVGNVKVKLYNNTAIMSMRMFTGPLSGKTNFIYDFGKIEGTKREGLAYFSVSHLQFEAKVNQSLNLKKKPILDELQLETGHISVRFDGKGKLDYFVELIVSKLPTMIRHLIIDALEDSIKEKIQKDILNNVDVEEIVTNQLPLVEALLANKGK